MSKTRDVNFTVCLKQFFTYQFFSFSVKNYGYSIENKVEKLSAFLDSGKEKKREENLIKEESKKEISLYKYN